MKTLLRVGTYIDKFHMKVPWKNLYTDAVTADIDGVYIVAGPAAGTNVL